MTVSSEMTLFVTVEKRTHILSGMVVMVAYFSLRLVLAFCRVCPRIGWYKKCLAKLIESASPPLVEPARFKFPITSFSCLDMKPTRGVENSISLHLSLAKILEFNNLTHSLLSVGRQQRQ